MGQVQGGYAVITVGQFASVCAARKARKISFLALRIWLAAHEERAKRCTAKGRVQFRLSELAQLVRTDEASAERALGELTRLGLISWSAERISFPDKVGPEAAELAKSLHTSSKRPVPVPRYILRALFRHTRPSEVIAAIGHLVRCLFRKQGRIFNHGLVKASWVASTFGVAERSVHSARKWLVACGFLTQEVVHQLVLNRFGARFTVSLVQQARRVVRRRFAAPSLTRSCTKSTSLNQINNKPALKRDSAGACSAKSPSIRNVQPEDLKKLPRLEALYRDAVSAGWITDTEANVRNFVCAALRATRAGGRVGAIFVGIVRKKLWHHVTQEQEDRAVSVLKRYREKHSAAFGTGKVLEPAKAYPVSGLLKSVVAACSLPSSGPVRADSALVVQ